MRTISHCDTNTHGLKVPQNIVEQQQAPIKMIELEEAIKKMNNNKTPGEDGLPVRVL